MWNSLEVRAQRNSVIDIPCNLKYILMRSRVCELLACGVYREKITTTRHSFVAAERVSRCQSATLMGNNKWLLITIGAFINPTPPCVHLRPALMRLAGGVTR